MKKLRLFYLLIPTLFVLSCSQKEDPAPQSNEDLLSQLTPYNQEVVSYFKEIALGFEFGGASPITRRWEENMYVYVGGTPDSVMLNELDTIISEINDLATTSFRISQVTDSTQSNYYIFIGSGDEYGQIFPDLTGLIASNFGLFSVYWQSDMIYTGYMYVDIYRATPEEQLHILREELTQSLGLAKDSYRYPESIFQQSYDTKTTTYAQIDRDLIRLLYHPEMRVGLDATQVEKVLATILLSEQ